MLTAATGLDQRHASGTERAFLGFIGDHLGAVAAEKGQAEVYLIWGAVNQHPDTDDFPLALSDGIYRIAKRGAAGENVVNDEDTLAATYFKASTIQPFAPTNGAA